MNESGLISELEIGGMLILENAEQLRKEFVDAIGILNDHIIIKVSNLDEIDIPCIQLFIAFIKKMNDLKIKFKFNWNIDEDQKMLLENVGLSDELFMNNSYV